MKPYIHAENSAQRFGGKPEDYLKIHNLMDSSKSAIGDNRHRALTHNSWFLFILEEIFGVTITNSDNKKVSVRDIGEQHILEDFRNRFIPSAQDYLQEMEFKDWMENGKGLPPSSQKLGERLLKDSPMEVKPEPTVFDDFNNSKEIFFDGSNVKKPYKKPYIKDKFPGPLLD